MDVYYSPEKYGLEIIGTAEDTEASYAFDMFVVWRDASGQLYWAEDSGCSCPSPFEDYTRVDQLAAATVAEIHEALDKWASLPSQYRRVAETTAELHATLAGL